MSYKDFKVSKGKILKDVVIFQPEIFRDNRGNIFTTYNQDFYSDYLPLELNFKHDKFAYNHGNVLRGLHGDNKTWKLVSCVYGRIYEVVVDMRPKSPNYMLWEAFELNSANYQQVLIPPGFVNGYYVLSEDAVFHYKLAYEGSYIDAAEQRTLLWNDKNLNIDWPCKDPILQSRDKKLK
jgi:dTDP-4-dehydrorhamnose 3,5-epimerase